MKVHIDVDDDGYIASWGTDYTVENMVEVDETELDKIVLGASKLIDGEIVVDKAKQVELEAEANKVVPTTEQQLIATLSLRLAQMEAKS